MTNATPLPRPFVNAVQRRTVQHEHAAKLSADRCVAQMRIANCLDFDQLTAVRAAVLDCDRCWSARPGGYATLGTASYLDATQDRATYLQRSTHDNAILAEKFSELYETVVGAMQRALGSRVRLAQDLAFPGFHVYQSFSPGNQPGRNAHFDLQWMHAVPNELPEATLSFTVPIELPRQGGSMWLWPLRFDEVSSLGMPVVDYALSTPPSVWNYEVGALYVRDGFDLHAIGRTEAPSEGCRRITLQGHGIRRYGVWYLYW
jgi:hypothetical protein